MPSRAFLIKEQNNEGGAMIWLVDTSYICYRSFFSMPALGGDAVLFGSVRVATQIYDIDPMANIVWCFDVGVPKRRAIDPEYKKSRETRPKHVGIDMFYKAMTTMRTVQLHDIGFENLLWDEGYEADDIIASVCQSEDGEKVIVSADHDLYQLLDDKTSMFKLKTGMYYTVDMFRDEYNIDPSEWSKVKAIAGCSSDNVAGIKGVGEKTAIRFLNNELKDTLKTYKAIKEGKDQCMANFAIVDLPLKGTPTYELSYNTLDKSIANAKLQDYSIRDIRF